MSEKSKGMELTDEELNEIVGGVSTNFVCENCGTVNSWAGNYRGWRKDCPMCGRKDGMIADEVIGE